MVDDGPDARVVRELQDVKLELMQLNLYLRDLLMVSGRELPTPQVTVTPTPVVVEAPALPSGVLTPEELLQALSGLARPHSDDAVVGAVNNLADEVKKSLEYSRAVAGAAYGPSGGGVVHIDPAVAEALQTIVAQVERSLTDRMLAKAPQVGYQLWLDTADSTYIYIAEAPDGAVGTDTSFQGVRVAKDASGNPLGKVEVATAFVWDDRSTASWA